MSLVGLRPARAIVLRGGWPRNLRASFTTYLPVKPDAPRIIRSYSYPGLSLPRLLFASSIVQEFRDMPLSQFSTFFYAPQEVSNYYC